MPLRLFRRSGFPAAARHVTGTLTLAFLWLPLTGTTRADIQNPRRSSFPGERTVDRQGEKPASAVPQTTSVVEGGTVTIILRAHGHPGEMVDFLIRTPPAHGTLDAAPRQLTLNTASVTYTQRPGDNAAEDSFTYAVQTRGGPVSAEARITLRIQEPPPVLAVNPAELDFGAVKAGGSTRAEVTLANQGGGEAVGRVDPPAPWVVEGPAEYHLPRGASQTFVIVFQPQAERAYADALHFRYETDHGGVHLVGTGLPGPGRPLVALTPDTLGSHPLSTHSEPAGINAAASLPPVAEAALQPAASSGPTAAPATASLEPAGREGSSPSLPSAALTYNDVDNPGVASFEITSRGRTTLDLRWRTPSPLPKSYRVELQSLSLDPDDRLVVEWRPYAQVEFQTASGFVTAHLSGLSADTQHCLRVVAVDAGGRLTAPSSLRVVYTIEASTWWQPTALKVLLLLLLVCGGLLVRHRWENAQILREIDESRRRTARA